jgi:hypothetical protein
MSGHGGVLPRAKTGPTLFGYLVEFDDPHVLVHACETVRDAGYTHWDAHTPFPVHGLNDAMGLKPTRLPYFVFLCGLAGLCVGLGMQWWMNAYDYPYLISGKPIWSVPANVPVMFELTVLFSAFGAFFGMWFGNRLPRYYHRVFCSERFSRATDDRFFISLEASDPRFDAVKTLALAESLGGLSVETVEGGGDA